MRKQIETFLRKHRLLTKGGRYRGSLRSYSRLSSDVEDLCKLAHEEGFEPGQGVLADWGCFVYFDQERLYFVAYCGRM